jgi:hypothetical protein
VLERRDGLFLTYLLMLYFIGSIVIDGFETADMELKLLRSRLSVIPQVSIGTTTGAKPRLFAADVSR